MLSMRALYLINKRASRRSVSSFDTDVSYLYAERPYANADLRQVERTLLVQRLRRERIRVADAERLDEASERCDALAFAHHAHRLDLRRLEHLVVPVDRVRQQLVNESRRILRRNGFSHVVPTVRS